MSLLHQGLIVLYADIDTVWLKDPFKDIGAAGWADMYLTIDHPGTQRPFCTCFMFVRPTAASRQVIRAWGVKVVGQTSNQGAFNDELRRLKPSTRIVVKALPVKRYPHGGKRPSAYKNVAVLHAN